MSAPVVVTTSPQRSSRGSKLLPTRSSLHTRRTALSSFGASNLSELARETKRKIKWDAVLRGSGAHGAQWKWLENVRNFSIYTKQGLDAASGYGVLSIGTIRASVPEVASLLVATNQDEHELRMAALHDKQFKSGAYLGDVAPDESTTSEDENVATHLSVRSATFARLRWLQRDDQWCYLEDTQYDREHQRFEKLLTSLTPEDVTQLDRKPKFTDAKRFRDLVGGYCVQPEETEVSLTGASLAAHSVRVHFYAELDAPTRGARGFGRLVRASTKHEASTKAMKQRMVQLAKDCDRLAHLVRRRRLGMQVLVDQRRVLPPTNVPCVNCEKTMLLAKLCRVCGQGVCGDCSDKYERETHTLARRRGASKQAGADVSSRRVRLETIRVCDPCIQRVETADYSHMSDNALAGAAVFPDRNSSNKAPSAAGDLKQLLHDALLEAPSTQRKGTVMSVIRCVLDQEKALTPTTEPSPLASSFDGHMFEPVMLTPLSADSEYIHALDGLELAPTPFDDVETGDLYGRPYAVQHNADIAVPMPFPIPSDEAQRVSEIEKLGIVGAGTCDELNIICDIAAKEMDAFATIVTIITSEEQHVVAANVPALEQMVMKREDAFCAHTIMANKPLIVPHPEADVRFSRIMPVTGMGIKYYCGFPITAGDDKTVIGTLCCVDQKKHDITESQYNAMQRLAKTAAKVVKMQGERRRNSSVAARTASTSA